MPLPRSLANLKREFSETKWNEAKEWSYSRINRKKYRPSKKQLLGSKQGEAGIPLLPAEDGAHPHRRIPAPGHQEPTIRTVLVVRAARHQANSRAPLQSPRNRKSSRRPCRQQSERPPNAARIASRSQSSTCFCMGYVCLVALCTNVRSYRKAEFGDCLVPLEPLSTLLTTNKQFFRKKHGTCVTRDSWRVQQLCFSLDSRFGLCSAKGTLLRPPQPFVRSLLMPSSSATILRA